jgi:transposase
VDPGVHSWLRTLRFEDSTAQAVFDADRVQAERQASASRGLEEALATLAAQPAYAQAVRYLRCFRGIDTLTAIGLVVELFDFGRFASPRGLMSYLGLVPTGHSTGGHPRREGGRRSSRNPTRFDLLRPESVPVESVVSPRLLSRLPPTPITH